MKNQKRKLFRLIVPRFPNFNIYSRIARQTTALGPICVATTANKLPDWDVEVIDENNYKIGPKNKIGLPDHYQLQIDRPATAVGFYGSLTCTIPCAYKLAKLYQKLGVKTIAGGKHIEAMAEEALNSGIDVAVLGEGEDIIVEILSNQPLKNIKGIAFKITNKIIKTAPRPLIRHFDRLPLPDFNLLRHAYPLKLYPIGMTRGCNMNCEFCAVKDQARCSGAEKLMAQTTKLVETKGAKYFFIVDDHFGENKVESIKFCQLIIDYQKSINRKLNFSAQIRLNDARHLDLLTAMRKAEIKNVFIGYESPIDEELMAMKKGYLSKDMVKWTRTFHQLGFYIHGMFIFGYPSSFGKPLMPLKEKTKKFRKFINQAKIDTVQILHTVPLPGTQLRKRLKTANRLYNLGWEYYDGQFPLYEPDKGNSPEELQQAVSKIMSTFYHFHHFWKIGLKILYFPLAMIPSFTLRDIKANFHRWNYYWQNDIRRFGGHIIVTRWFKNFKKDDFLDKLAQAKHQLKKKSNYN